MVAKKVLGRGLRSGPGSGPRGVTVVAMEVAKESSRWWLSR